MNECMFLYVTAPDNQTATDIARTLTAENLAACVNIHAPMRSCYRWEGSIESSQEIPLIVKTTKSAAGAACDRILELHPHDTPCVAALPISPEGSSASFLNWIGDATNS